MRGPAGEGSEQRPAGASPAITLTLAGAYHPEGKPLVQKRIVVEATLPLSLVFGESRLSACVSVEDVAATAPAEGMVRLSRGSPDGPSEVSADVTFTGEDGSHYVLSLGTMFSRRGIRALTEVEGALTRVPGALVGPVRLRLDWRALFRGA